MNSLVEALTKPFFEIKGEGIIVFGEQSSAEVYFIIQMSYNGKITGELDFRTFHEFTWDYLKQMKSFILKGKESNKNVRIVAENCVLTHLSESDDFLKSTTKLRGTFSVHSAIMFPEALKIKPEKELFFQAGVISLYRTFRVIVETKIGTLLVGHYKGIEESERLMRLYHVPLITSFIQLSVSPDGSQTLENILNKGKEIIQDFLKITSLYQLVWHDWAFLTINYKQENANSGRPIFVILTSPKEKIPISRSIGSISYSNDFINAAWKGYSKELDYKYSFTSALEWLIESNAAGLFETKFLNATTCFEMLMDKFHSENGTEFILDDVTYEEFYNAIKQYSSSFLKSKAIDKTIRSSIYKSLKGTKRRSFKDKAEMLLDYWGISYSDTGISLDQVVEVRNAITHRGRYLIQGEKDFEYSYKVYTGLLAILIRIFLAILHYSGHYQDISLDKWIKFNEVCSKI